MDRLQLFIALCVVTCVSCSPLTLDITNRTALPGAHVTLNCRITGLDPSKHQVFWTKFVDTAVGSPMTELIASGGVMHGKYGKISRYTHDKAELGGVSLRILKINGVKAEDSGHFRCSVPNMNDESASVNLQVFKKPDSISFYNVTNNEIHAKHMDQVNLQCSTNNSIPTPHLMVDSPMFRWIHIKTPVFQQRTGMNVQCPSDGAIGQPDCILHVTYRQEIYYDKFKLTYKMDGHTLTSMAHMPHFGHDQEMSTKVTLRVKHSPHFDCDAEQKAPLHGRLAVIRCLVSANPAVKNIFWRVKAAGGDTEKIVPGQPSPNSDYKASTKTLNASSTEVSLVIDQVFQRHFQLYELHAENDLSKAPDLSEKRITLKEDTSHVAGGAGSAAVTSLALGLTVAMSIMSANLRRS